MKIGAHIVRKRLTSGIVWYVYAWRGGPQIARLDGPAKPRRLSPSVLRQIANAQAEREVLSARTPDTLRSLIRLWRSENPNRPSSPDWDRLAASTKKTWGAALNAIEAKWGDVPLSLFNDPRMKAKVVAWRDSRSATPRAADIGVTVLSTLLKFGTFHARVLTNVAAGIPALYRGGDRAEIIWTDDEIARFVTKATEMGLPAAADALRLAATTGLRREDLVTLKWEQVGPSTVGKKALKRSRGKRRHATIPRVPQLDRLLEELAARARQENVHTVLVDDNGACWSPDRLTKAVNRVRDALDIVHVDHETGVRRKKHLHDARGTFVTKLITSKRCSDQEIADIMGWSPQQVSDIRRVYVDQGAVVVAIGERLNRAV